VDVRVEGPARKIDDDSQAERLVVDECADLLFVALPPLGWVQA
jgi:hypothetical protein